MENGGRLWTCWKAMAKVVIEVVPHAVSQSYPSGRAALEAIMIRGAAPRVEWKLNPEGATRTIEEACEIARRWGVIIPSYVQFFADEYNYLDENTTAKTTTFREPEGTMIDWSWFFHEKTGKIPFLIRKDVLASDEAIVAVMAHEMYELERLHSIFAAGAPIEKWEAETSPNNPGNSHWQAWDYADDLVARMREEEK
ncbi:MAG: hypothetical protein ACP5XB_25620 [Isosphaeraceae bacterium]